MLFTIILLLNNNKIIQYEKNSKLGFWPIVVGNCTFLDLYAQSPVTTLSPFGLHLQRHDQITITADVTGTPMAGATTALIWIWCYPNVADQAADANAITAPGAWMPEEAGAGLQATPGPAMMTNIGRERMDIYFSVGAKYYFGLLPGICTALII